MISQKERYSHPRPTAHAWVFISLLLSGYMKTNIIRCLVPNICSDLIKPRLITCNFQQSHYSSVEVIETCWVSIWFWCRLHMFEYLQTDRNIHEQYNEQKWAYLNTFRQDLNNWVYEGFAPGEAKQKLFTS